MELNVKARSSAMVASFCLCTVLIFMINSFIIWEELLPFSFPDTRFDFG